MTEKIMVSLTVIFLLFAALQFHQVTGLFGNVSAEEEVVINVGMTWCCRTMNPFTECPDYYYHMFFFYESLLYFDDKHMDYAPELAESWEVSSDLKTWTFHLVQNATWHDGEKFTADDVVFTYNFMMENKIGMSIIFLKDVESVTAPDDYTVTVRLKEPCTPSYVLSTFPIQIMIVPKHLWGNMTAEEAEASEIRIGTGPFEFVEWKKMEYLVLRKYDKWYHKPPAIDKIIYTFYASDDPMIEALKTGKIDIMYQGPRAAAKELMANPDIKVVDMPHLLFHDIGFNCFEAGNHTRPPLLDKRVRVALDYATDKELIVTTCLLGYGLVPDSYVHPISPWHNENLKAREFNLTKAAEILTEAGYVDRDGDGVRESPDGIKLDFTMYVASSVSAHVRGAEMCKWWWGQIGVKIDPVVADYGTLFSIIWGETGTDFDFDMFMWCWGGSLDPVDFLSYLTADQIGANSDTGWNNTEYNQLYEEQSHATSDEERKQIIDRMQEIIHEEVPYILLDFGNAVQYYRCDRWKMPTGFKLSFFNVKVALEVTPVGHEVVEKPVIALESWIIAGVGIAVAVIAVAYGYKKSRK